MSGVAGALRSTDNGALMPDAEKQSTGGQPALVQAALQGLCPRCGAKTLFAGPTRFAKNCGACGLDYDQYNVGDGPAAFLTLIVGGLVTALAMALELTVMPPFWVHILLWVPLTAFLVVATLRAAKGMLLIQEHRKAAAEGKLVTAPASTPPPVQDE